MKNRTCTACVLLKDGKPIRIVQTEWLLHCRSFSMSRTELFSYMHGYCDAMGDMYTFDDYTEKLSLPIVEV